MPSVNKQENVLALDLGTKLGMYTTGSEKADTVELGSGDDRFGIFFNTLEHDLMLNPNLKAIAYEDAAFQRGNAIPVYHGLVAVLKLFCKLNNIEYVGIPVGTVKKIFVGKGNANKKDIMAQCDKLGIKYDDDNSADAYAVWWTYVELNK